jgi:membrane-bound ClpP family serine protease
MTFFVIIALILVGWLLLFIEILFIPGVTILILSGIILIVTGIYLSFADYGTTMGFYTLLGTFLLVAVSLIMAFRSGFWKKMSLKDSNDAKMNTIDHAEVKPGMTAKSISKIGPSGKALIGDTVYEVHSEEGYIAENSVLEVVKIYGNRIFVKLKSN